MRLTSKFLHKCIVYKVGKEWFVEDKACHILSINKNWRRAALTGMYHFKIEMSEGITRVLSK